MKPQHATFILQMIKHGDKLRAYKAAYPKAKGQSAIKAAERLLRQPHIAEEIQNVVHDIRSATIVETYKVMQQEQQVRILSVMKKREILNQIATCEMKVGRWIKDEDGYRMVYQDPSPRDIIHAIDKDTKLEEACNRMRDITDIKLSRYDIYIDGRPCDNPNAPINPDIPTGLIMLPKKKHASSFPTVARNEAIREGGTSVASDGRVDEGYSEAEQISSEFSGNPKEQNKDNSPFEGGTPQAGGMSTREGQTLAPDLILNDNSGNKKEQNKDNSPFEGGTPQAGGMSTREGQTLAPDLILNDNSGNKKKQNIDNLPFEEGTPQAGEMSTREGQILEHETPTCEPLRLSVSAVALAYSGVKEYDYLHLKKQHLAEKQQRTDADPMSESFYKNFTRERDAAPYPDVYTDEEAEAIKNDPDREQKETKKHPYCGKMYFPEKTPQPGDDITGVDD